MNSFRHRTLLAHLMTCEVGSVHSKNLLQVPKINFRGVFLGWVHLQRNLFFLWMTIISHVSLYRAGWQPLVSLGKNIFFSTAHYISRLLRNTSFERSKKCRCWQTCRERRINLPTYQHCKWKAAGQWSQHRRSPPSRQLSQVSWLVALPLLRGSLSGFRFFSPSSDFGGASSVCICCKWIDLTSLGLRLINSMCRLQVD